MVGGSVSLRRMRFRRGVEGVSSLLSIGLQRKWVNDEMSYLRIYVYHSKTTRRQPPASASILLYWTRLPMAGAVGFSIDTGKTVTTDLLFIGRCSGLGLHCPISPPFSFSVFSLFEQTRHNPPYTLSIRRNAVSSSFSLHLPFSYPISYAYVTIEIRLDDTHLPMSTKKRCSSKF